MTASNFILRGIPQELMATLKKEAKRLRISVNTLMLKMIEQGLGFSKPRSVHRDLDHLAGSWSVADEKAFKETIEPFEQVDEELWQ